MIFSRNPKASFINTLYKVPVREYFLNMKIIYSTSVANTLCHGEILEAVLLHSRGKEGCFCNIIEHNSGNYDGNKTWNKLQKWRMWTG